jgi:hypothetical protein
MYCGIETKPQITDYNTNYKAVNKLLIYPSSFPFPSLDPIRNWTHTHSLKNVNSC